MVIVPGAGGGMGSAMAIGLLLRGARVAGVESDAGRLEALTRKAAEISAPDRVLPIAADVRSPEGCDAILEETVSRWGAVHVLVNNAGIGMQSIRENYMDSPVRFWEADLDRWQRLMDVNWKGPYMLARAAAPRMIAQGWGRIVNVTTSLDTMHRRAYTPYGPSKAALEAASASWAGDLEGTGVTVNVLVPGGPTNTGFIPESPRFDRTSLVQPGVMVAPICWLASDASNGVTGSRFVGRLWDPNLPAAEAAARSKSPAAWPGLGTQATWPDAK